MSVRFIDGDVSHSPAERVANTLRFVADELEAGTIRMDESDVSLQKLPTLIPSLTMGLLTLVFDYMEARGDKDSY